MTSWRRVDAPRSLRQTLSSQRHGRGDPTTALGDREFRLATHTPTGPGTLRLRWSTDLAPSTEERLDAEAWGPGAAWLLDGVDLLTGTADRPVAFDDAHPAVERALRLRRHVRVGASRNLYHALLPTIIAQRITAGEAAHQWRRLCRSLGDRPPGPPDAVQGLVLPPTPESLHRRPAWWFHPLGIESARATALVGVARHAGSMWGWAESGVDAARERLALIPGIGPWTVGSVLGPGLGDPDAVAVGDYHLPNAVAWALAGEPRADDRRMLELLEPYRGQRGRVIAALVRTAGHAPSFGPRQRILPMSRW